MDSYEKLEKVGEGTYGKVYKAKDKKTGKLVALKKTRLENDGEGIPPTALREISLLQMLSQDMNIVRLLDVEHTENKNGKPLLYLVFEYMDSDLKKYIDGYRRSHTKMSPKVIKSFMYQLCQGVAYCHSRGVMHRDLKPHNLLVDKQKGILRTSAVEVHAEEPVAGTTEEAIVKASAQWPEGNPFANVINGQQNYINILFENKTPKDVVIAGISGSFSNPKTGVVMKNTTAQKLGISIAGGGSIQLPYAFHSEFKPMEARFKVIVDAVKDSVTEQVTAYDGLVTITEPKFSFFDWQLISTWSIILALLAGGTYFTYLSFFPAPKAKTKKAPLVAEKVDTPVTPGSGVYNEDWIPAHHIKKPKTKAVGAASSGDESDRRKRR